MPFNQKSLDLDPRNVIYFECERNIIAAWQTSSSNHNDCMIESGWCSMDESMFKIK